MGVRWRFLFPFFFLSYKGENCLDLFEMNAEHCFSGIADT